MEANRWFCKKLYHEKCDMTEANFWEFPGISGNLVVKSKLPPRGGSSL